MRLFLLGATGNTGRRILRFALERGHAVTAFVRDQNKLKDILGASLPEPLHIIVGDIDGSADLAKAMGGHDVVHQRSRIREPRRALHAPRAKGRSRYIE